MNETNQHSDSWDSCPEGALAQTVAQLKSRRRNRALAISVGPVVVLLLIVLTGTMAWQSLSTSDENHYGGVSCTQVRSLLAEYGQGTLEETLALNVAIHLKQCLMCRTSYESMQDTTDQVSQVLHGHQCDSCDHAHSVLLAQLD